MEGLPNLVQQYKDLHIDMVRTHDIMGPTDIAARYSVDNPLLAWLVPDSNRGPRWCTPRKLARFFPIGTLTRRSPRAITLQLRINSYRESGRIRRRGVLPHRPQFWRRLRDLPDFDKFAAVVTHIAMHYNQGWANGFHDNIRYWEFWNEPDLPLFWTETPETFYSLYEKTARALKSIDPSIKVGGDAQALAFNAGPYREG